MSHRFPRFELPWLASFIFAAACVGCAVSAAGLVGCGSTPDPSGDTPPGDSLPDDENDAGGGGNGDGPSDGGSGDGQTKPQTSGAQCTIDFCWEAPTPSGNTLGGVWAASPNDVWWVGKKGTVLHFDGTKTSAVEVPATDELYAITGTSPSDIWIGGDNGVLIHFDGTKWTRFATDDMKSGSLRLQLKGLVSPKAGELFIATASNFLRRTPTGVTEVYPSDPRAIGMAPDGTVWINAGYKFRRWNGSAFVEVTSPPSYYAYEMTFSSPNAGWAATSGGIARWNGTAWSHVVLSGLSSHEAVTISGAADDDVWALGYGGLIHYDGTSWKEVDVPALEALPPTDSYFRSLRLKANAKNDVWLGSVGGLSFHWDGTSWKRVSPLPVASYQHLIALSANDVWASAGASVVHFDGTAWTIDPSAPGFWRAAVAVGPKTAFAATSGKAIARYDGTRWTTVPGVTGDRVWGSAPDDVWVIDSTSSTGRRFDGSSWSDVALPTKSEVIWGTGKNDVWISGEDPAVAFSVGVWRWNGTSWTKFQAPGSGDSVVAFGGSANGDVFAVAGPENFRTAYRFTGTGFAITGPFSGLDRPRALWSRGPSETYAVGSGGAISRWNGSTWLEQASPAGNELLAVTGTQTDGPWVVGAWGTILKKL